MHIGTSDLSLAHPRGSEISRTLTPDMQMQYCVAAGLPTRPQLASRPVADMPPIPSQPAPVQDDAQGADAALCE